MLQPASAPSEPEPKRSGALRVLLQLILIVWLVLVSVATLLINNPTIADPIAASFGVSEQTMESFRAPFKGPVAF